jgi:steroid delta-isomerase-like uncharacterized protein
VRPTEFDIFSIARRAAFREVDGIFFVPTCKFASDFSSLKTAKLMSGDCHMEDPAAHERNKALVSRIVEEMFNRGELEVAPEIFGPEFVDRGHEQVAGKKDGPEGFAGFVRSIRSALPDLKATIQNMVAEGDYVAMWNTATATHRGELFGMPATGKRITMKDFHFFRFSNGKIVEHWNQVGLS